MRCSFAPIGEKVGKLTIIGDAPTIGSRRYWIVRCECGNECVKQAIHIAYARVKSCGNCKRVRGQSQSPEYRAWRDAIARCTKPFHEAWKHYGGRGISVCPEWVNNFAAFLAHIGPKPARHLTLERIDNNGNYEPGNVKWATRKEQFANTRHAPKYRQSIPNQPNLSEC